LLRPSVEGITRYDGEISMFRGPSDACAIEPALAELIFAGRTFEIVDQAIFEAGLPEALDLHAVNLRQGAFAKRHRLRLDVPLARRLALLLLAVLLTSLSIQVTSLFRYTFAADRAEAEAAALAASALPPGTHAVNPGRQLRQRLADLGGSNATYSTLASILFAAIRDTPGIELTAITYEGGSLRAAALADSPATLSAIQQRIAASGLDTSTGPLNNVNGRHAAEIMVRPR
jgi:general secretion pathway protein L